MNFSTDLLAALKARWRLEVAILLGVIVLVALWSAISPKIYTADASLLFDDAAVDPMQGGPVSSDSVAGLLSTEAAVLKSETVAAEVVRAQQLATPAVVERWQGLTGGDGDVNAWYGQQLVASLDVIPERGSRLLTIRYNAADPQFAAGMANAFASAYLDQRLRRRTDPARTYSRWFQERTREVRTSLEQAQARLTEFQRRTGIVDTGQVNAENNRLAELSSQLTSAEASAAELNARAGGGASQSPDVQSSGVVQGLRAQISAKTAQISQMSATLGPNHPDRMAAQAELATLQSRLGAEIGTTTRSVQVASGAASSKEGALRSRLEAQRSRMLGLASDRAQLDILSRDVESARLAYDAVTEKLGTMRLQSEAPATNVRQLDIATPPLFPSKPNIAFRLFLGVLLGVLLGVGVAAMLELIRPRVRTAAGLSGLANVPMIARVDFDQSRVGELLKAEAAR